MTTDEAVRQSPITVAMVDDHPATLAGLQAWLAASQPPIVVIAAGPTPAAAWTPPGRDAAVVVLDLKLDNDPLPSYGHLKRLVRAGRRVIVYTMLELDGIALTCLDLGAHTVLTKAEGQEHLVAAIFGSSDSSVGG
jgi:two-component system, NarL family, nitrate/nitrite response regulator NarL